MLGKPITNPETIKANQEWQKSMIEKAGAKDIEVIRIDDVKVGDVLQIKERNEWEIKEVKEGDITKEFGFKKLWNKNFIAGIIRFIF